MPITVDRSSAQPLREQIEAQLRDVIRIGGLLPGMAVPPTRHLAADLGVSRGVVVAAYNQLCSEGLLVSRSGAATTVTLLGREPRGVDDSPAGPRRPRREWRLDLDPEVPDIATFPRAAWRASLSSALTTLPTNAFDYRAMHGIPALREAMAAFLARSRGVQVSPEDIVLCSGYRQALGVLFAAVRATTATRELAISRVGHSVNRRLFAEMPLRTRWLDVDSAGMVIDGLTASDDVAVMINPLHHFPLGTALASDRLEAIDRSDLLVIEDDSNAHLQHDGRFQRAMQGSRHERTVYVGSLSRSLAPGVRLGFVVAPPDIARETTRLVGLWGLAPSTLEQSAMADFITRGGLDAHLRALRTRYRRRAGELRSAFGRILPAWEITTPGSGFHAVVWLPEGVAEGDVVAAAAKRGIALYGMARHVHAGPALPPAIVLGYGTLSRAAVPGVVNELAEIVGR